MLLLNGVDMPLFHIDPKSEGKLLPGEPVVGPVKQGSEYIGIFVGRDGVQFQTIVKIWKEFWSTKPGMFPFGAGNFGCIVYFFFFFEPSELFFALKILFLIVIEILALIFNSLFMLSNLNQEFSNP